MSHIKLNEFIIKITKNKRMCKRKRDTMYPKMVEELLKLLI